jgi:hypothetical protein
MSMRFQQWNGDRRVVNRWSRNFGVPPSGNHSNIWLAHCLLRMPVDLTGLRRPPVFCFALASIEIDQMLKKACLAKYASGKTSEVE